MKLLIVESPNKVKKIQSFLDDKEWIVTSSVGHVRELKNSGKFGLGVDLDTFVPEYKVIAGKQKVIDEINSYLGKVDEIYLASDPDREGEAIAWHVTQILEDDRVIVQRIVFNEITKNAVLEAIENPVELDMNLVRAQQARQILDKMIGFRLSNFTRKKVQARSAGRVKSAVLKLILEKENEIRKFVPEYWHTVEGELAEDIKLENIDNDHNLVKYKTEEEAQNIIDDISGSFLFIKQTTKEVKVKKPIPLDMASFLMKMYSSFGYSNSKASRIAQKLYEKGKITYPRTDSRKITSKEFLKSIHGYISSNYGEDSFTQPFVKQDSNAQLAHEAIRPTDINTSPFETGLKGEELKAYELVWKETLKSFLPDGVNISVKDIYEDSGHLFMIKRTVVKVPGFRMVDQIKEQHLPEAVGTLSVNKEKIEVVPHESKPPARYNQASLIKLMKDKGIGRPSTYTSTTTGLIKFGYLESDKGRLVPTEVAVDVDQLLRTTFPEIVDTQYTANMENDLDKIAVAEIDKDLFLKEFWEYFNPKLENLEATVEVKPLVQLDKKCPQCGSTLVERRGKFGKFVSCSNFPKCKYTENMDGTRKEEPKKTGEDCPECGSALVIRKRKRDGAEFVACSNFPKCKYIKNTTN